MVTTTQHRQIDWDWTERPRLISTAPPTSLALSRFLLFLRRDCLNRVSFNQQPATRFPAPSTCLGSVLLCNVWKIPLVDICPNKARHLSYWNPYKNHMTAMGGAPGHGPRPQSQVRPPLPFASGHRSCAAQWPAPVWEQPPSPDGGQWGNGGSLAFSDHNAVGITDHLVCSFNTSLATLAGNTQFFAHFRQNLIPFPLHLLLSMG